MKLNGQTLEGPMKEVVVIPRPPKLVPDPENPGQQKEIPGDIVFEAEAVLDYEDFTKLCPVPLPPNILRPGGVQSSNVEDPKYRAALQKWSLQRTNWMILKSLKATHGLEWDTVKWDDPETWGLYSKELADSGFSDMEVQYIIGGALTANALDEDKLEQARKRFLATRVGQGK